MSALSSRKKLGLLLALILIAAVAAYFVWQYRQTPVNKAEHQSLQPVEATGPTQPSYDVIVAGTDPEGVTAAVSAARNGLKVLLVDGKDREILGGLMTLGWLNSLDLNKSPVKSALPGKVEVLNKGLFEEWFGQVEGTSFDVNTAANVFNKMVADEDNIDLMMKVRKMEPLMKGQTVAGLKVEKADGTVQEIPAKAVIDATQDADIAAAAGVAYTYGREDIGEPDVRMAVTLVFKMSGVTQEIWESFGARDDTDIDKMSAWGFKGAAAYPSTNPKKVKLRGLNIGRQNDGTILINAMHIFDVDPFNPDSLREAMEVGRKEAPLMADFLTKTFPEFKTLKYAGTAPEFYVRETRHIEGEYRLNIIDLLENRDQWDAIAYGSYEVDIQSTGPDYPGAILMKPQAYGVPFRCLVPQKVDGLLVVGRSASFDSLPHGSARVIPLGMATGEAAGAAAKLAIDKGLSFRQLSASKPEITELQSKLSAQGMDMSMPPVKKPEYAEHPQYPGLVAAVSMHLTNGNYDNKYFDLDGQSNPLRFVYHWNMIKKIYKDKFPGVAADAIAGMVEPSKQTLSLDQAAFTIAKAAGLDPAREEALEELQQMQWIKDSTLQSIKDRSKLTNGDAFMIVRDVTEKAAGAKYE